MLTNLADRWWTLALRGAAAIVFGVLTFISPRSSLVALVLLFGAYALIDGVLNLVLAVRRSRDLARGAKPWGWLIFEGLISVGAGVLTLLWPGITTVMLLVLIALWSLITGVAEVVAAIRLRKTIRGEWLLGLSGVLSVAFGVVLLMRPGVGALVVTLWIGAYALVFGSLLVGLAFRLRSWGSRHERHVPRGGEPAPA